ncbi:MAG: hypothetical protein ACRENA_08955, partial [Vulcanimicrobiaceae bacterium]
MPLIPRACGFVLALILCWQSSGTVKAAPLSTFGAAGNDAVVTLLDVYYAGGGYWRLCNQESCRHSDSDWGADAATDALYLRWKLTHDPKLEKIAAELLASSPRYPQPCASRPCPWWSDTPAWDAVTAMREAQMLHNNPDAISRAEAALRYISESRTFIGGACPQIPFQKPQPQTSGRAVKTLETDATATKAAILLYKATLKPRYLDIARTRYVMDRRYFLDPSAPLYTVHVIDEGGTCVQESHRFFASVNGEMIWNGLQLFGLTHQMQYFNDALATAQAVDTMLSDERGVFVNLQGENDVVEPLVEAMNSLAVDYHVSFARTWILRNAQAALSARADDGSFSRFFDGPPQQTASIWETNGGLALEIVAAGLDPSGSVVAIGGWTKGQPAEALTTLPATITFE